MANDDLGIGFVGLGVMGEPMSANLVNKSGRRVTVYDVEEQRCARVEALGATRARDLGEVADQSEVIFLSLPAASHVESVVLGPKGLKSHARKGQTIVDMSTSPVALARRLGEELNAVGVTFVDAPVARTRQAAIDGTLSVMVGAPSQDVFEGLEPLMRCMASEVSLCGDVGAGALVKLLNNMIVFETVVALAEAVTVARRSGIVTDSILFDVLGKGSAASFALENHGKKALLPDQHPKEAFSSTYMLKDLTYALEAAQECGLRLASAELARDLLATAVERGFAENYHTSVVRIIESADSQIP